MNSTKEISTLKSIDPYKIRSDFPILDQKINGHQLVYFDNAATMQKPREVINKLNQYYSEFNANIHRGIHTLAEKATTAFEESRVALKEFINAPKVEEIIFTRGTTESINLVAATFGRTNIKSGDEVLITGMEHHSNIVPWQLLCEEKQAILKVAKITDVGEIDMDSFDSLLTEKTKIVAVNYASNTLGTINPVKELTKKTHDVGAIILIDGAQSAAHINIDVQDLDCDFFTISAHKMYGPTGAGILFGKSMLLEAMPPYQGGGEMIKDVTFEKTTYNDIPYKFEAGTPNIADVIGFKTAIDFVKNLGKDNIAEHEDDLLQYANHSWSQINGYQPIGTAENKVSVQSFNIEGIHHFDLGTMLDARGIAVRTGHHCTQPIMDGYGIEGTVRASFAVYNTRQEIDCMTEALERVVKIMR